jgi:hypothetical protein
MDATPSAKQQGKRKYVETSDYDSNDQQATPAPRKRRQRGQRRRQQVFTQHFLNFRPLPFTVPNNAISPEQLYGMEWNPNWTGFFDWLMVDSALFRTTIQRQIF